MPGTESVNKTLSAFLAGLFTPGEDRARSDYATCGAAYTGAATSAVAPRNRGNRLADSGTTRVAAAAAVSARAAIARCRIGAIWSQISVISPPTKIWDGVSEF